MPKIKIIPEAKKPSVPPQKDLSRTVDRFRPPGGKPPCPLTSVYNKQGNK